MLHIKTEIVLDGIQDSKRLVFILGWGNTLQDRWLDWFRDNISDQKWSLMVIEIPTEYSNFKEILEEINLTLQNFKCEILLAHSMGSLFARYISSENLKQRIFLSPFWKIPKRTLILGSEPISRALLFLLKWCRKPLLYRNFERSDIGIIDLPNSEPTHISPSTMHTVMRAQQKIPPYSANDLVIYCPDDRVIDPSVCHGITYQGGHLVFCVKERERILTQLKEIINNS